MTFETKDVKKLAKLSRLSIEHSQEGGHTAEEFVTQLTTNLNSIMDLVDTIGSLDTTNVEPLSHPYEIKQRFREDEVTETNKREQLQKGAPKVEAGLYLVPQVIE